jgi:hypothetical protein
MEILMATEQPMGIVLRSRLPTSNMRNLAVVVVVLALVGAVALTRGEGATPTEAAARDAVTQGIAALQRATIIAPPGTSANGVSQSDLAQRSAQIPSLLGQYFAGEPLTRFTKANQAALADQMSSSQRDIDGGVKQSQITSLTIDGNEATGTLRALVWIKGQSSLDGTTNASQGWWDYTFHLVRQTGGWRIDQLTFTPEPGSEP